MGQLAALSLAIGVLGGVATWIYLASGMLLIWATFIGWGCFFHCGGDDAALRNTIVGTVFGSLVATIAAIIIVSVHQAAIPGALFAGIVVGVTVWAICIAAQVKALSIIPANVYGYAATFAYLLQTPDRLTPQALTSVSMNNAFIIVGLSLIVGAVLGYVSGKLGAALKKA